MSLSPRPLVVSMQPWLDFLYEHTLDRRLYCALPSDVGELELCWNAEDPHHWHVQPVRPGPAELVPRARLLAHLEQRGADLTVLEHELRALVATHIVVADQLLAAAHDAFGSESVSAALRGHQQFVRDLRKVLGGLLAPRLRVVH